MRTAPLTLATIEDFEKAANALDYPDSKPWEYTIRTYGFCNFCYKITEYISECRTDTGGVIICTVCSGIFGYFMGRHTGTYILCAEDAPDKFRAELALMQSREKQEEFFHEQLEQRLKELKAQLRAVKTEVRRFARLRKP